MDQRTCSIDNCDSVHEARGWCKKHYQCWRRNGNPFFVTEYQKLRIADIETRFLAKVIVLADGCWEWTAAADRYGHFREDGASVLAHRWSYEHWIAPIPDEHQVDHYRYPQDGCIGTLCVNPNHLRPATPRENTLRSGNPVAWNVAKTHCPQGHPYAGDNLRIKRSGARVCRSCDRTSMLARYYKRKQIQEQT